ncbi:MAG: hydratase [Gemmiger sp.]|nr:hydratase [Gemmiger sp.]
MKLHDTGVYLVGGKLAEAAPIPQAEAKKGTIAYGILKAHNTGADMADLRLKFDSMTSHDITYVGIIQTARASGMTEFPLPYVMTNCHNSLCAVGGTINEDDHQFALSAAHKYGGIYVPTNMAVIHSYNREMMSGCGRMILGSDSHTRYGALGTMAVGEGGGELAKQLVGRTYDMAMPGVVAVYLTGKLRPGVGPHDVALALVGATYACGYVKNKVMEFIGPGVAALSADYRNGIDVMTTETTCWSSIWQTDGVTERYFAAHGRPEAYKPLMPAEVAYYDGCIELDLSAVECMIALPMHPSYAYPIRELQADPARILAEAEAQANRQLNGKVKMDLTSKIGPDGKIHVDQGTVAGCSGGTFENICAVASLLKGKNCGNGVFTCSVYPDSMPTYLELVKNGAVADIVAAGGIFRECFCGPCFGAGDTPANGEFSIRHTTRNFPNREGSKPGEGQICGVALMDARSIAATAANGGVLTAASDVMTEEFEAPAYHFEKSVYDKRVYNGWGHPEPDYALRFGPNIKDWPAQPALSADILLKVVSYITDPVTTTDELIPSGETSSYRSNPLRLAEFTLSRKDPAYVPNAKAVKALDAQRQAGAIPAEVEAVYAALRTAGCTPSPADTTIGSAIFATKPGDGSAREQAASCQRVLGGAANLAVEYATKRYRSNCINWGMLPFLVTEPEKLHNGDYLFVPGARKALLEKLDVWPAYVVGADGKTQALTVSLGALTDDERQILADGCLINYYREH